MIPVSPREEPGTIRTWVFLLLVLLVALILRLPGLSWGLPGAEHRWSYQPDESTFFLCMANFRPAEFTFNPVDFSWPSFMLYILSTLFFLLDAVGLVPLVADTSFYASHPQHLTHLYLAGRLVTLVCAGAAILMAGRLALRMGLDRSGALLAAALVAILPVHIANSTIVSPHMLSTAFAAGAVLSAFRILEDRSKAVYVRSGILWGLAVGALYDAWILVVPLAVAHLLATRRPADLARFLLLCLVAIASFFVVNPYVILSPGDFAKSLGDIKWYMDMISPSPTAFARLLLLGFSLPLASLAAIGAVTACLRFRGGGEMDRRAFVIAVWFLVCSALITWAGTDFLRRLLPIAVPAALLAAYALSVIPRRARAILIMLVLFAPLWTTLAWIRTYTIGDTRTQATAWVNANLPEGTRIGYYNWFLGPHLDMRRYRCVMLDTAGFPEPVEYYVATEREMKSSEALERWPGATLVARFRHEPAFFGMKIDESRAPEDWFYTHPDIYVLRLGG